MCPIPIPQDKVTNKQLIWFMFQKTKYLYNEEEGRFQPLTFHTSETYSFYRDCRGYTTDMKAEAAKQLYGRNKWAGLLFGCLNKNTCTFVLNTLVMVCG